MSTVSVPAVSVQQSIVRKISQTQNVVGNINEFVANWLIDDVRDALDLVSQYRKTCETEKDVVAFIARAIPPVAFGAASTIPDNFFSNCVLTVLQLADWDDVATRVCTKWSPEDEARLAAIEAEELEIRERIIAAEIAADAMDGETARVEFWRGC